MFFFTTPILTKALLKRVFFSIFALTLTKALPKRVLFYIFTLILTKAPTKKDIFLYFCPLAKPKSYAIKGFWLGLGQK